MNWFLRFFTSSIGRKLIMSLTGLFLIVFLLVHLMGNLQLLSHDHGESFNHYAAFMSTNGFIQFTAKGLYVLFLVHAIQGLILWRKNATAKGTKYAVKANSKTNFASRNMIWFGILIFVFLVLHMGDFWAQMHFGELEMQGEYKNLYALVVYKFQQPLYVAWYVFSMIVLGIHLWHGFQSAFQSMGVNHPKYSPWIKTIGIVISVGLSIGYAIIPIIIYINHL